MLHDDLSIGLDAETCFFCDAFRLNVGLQLLSHLTSENYKIFPQLRLFLFVGPAEPIWPISPVIAIVWLIYTSF